MTFDLVIIFCELDLLIISLFLYYLFIYICNVTFDFSYSTIFCEHYDFFIFVLNCTLLFIQICL